MIHMHPYLVRLIIGFITLFGTVSYLIGSIPTGYLIVKAKTGKDIRDVGSGSTGATNVKRVLGTKWFIIVMILDAIKGAVPVLIAQHLFTTFNIFNIFPAVAALFVIIGHAFPTYIGYKGGKSMATGVGVLLALNLPVGIITAVIWAIATFTSGYVSAGSIIAIVASPILMYLFKSPKTYVIYCVLAALFIILLHIPNIKRLIDGTENKIV